MICAEGRYTKEVNHSETSEIPLVKGHDVKGRTSILLGVAVTLLAGAAACGEKKPGWFLLSQTNPGEPCRQKVRQ